MGTARGLTYLHEQCDPKIIHRDVKAANILLDKDFEAVVGDFGLAKLLDHQDSHVTTAVRGTVGHIAPEYLSTGQSSEKTDVFGFGILLLELITGLKAVDFGRVTNQKGVMLDWVCFLSNPPFVGKIRVNRCVIEQQNLIFRKFMSCLRCDYCYWTLMLDPSNISERNWMKLCEEISLFTKTTKKSRCMPLSPLFHLSLVMTSVAAFSFCILKTQSKLIQF